MKRSLLMLLLCVMVAGVGAETISEDAFVSQARQKAMALGKDLKGTLKPAIKSGGFEKGIEVCKSAAPALAENHSEDGWLVGRTALKVRNPGNAPSEWQREQLQAMQDQPVVNGKPAEVWRTVDTEKGPRYDYMSAIPTQGLCLSCHGENIEPKVQATIDRLYPQDEATGFKKGELRGAFVVQYWPER
ncbi:DUF3365 domain-containing protein [Marinobacteraceae bacterium S3BR75-40.1]